MPGRKASLPLLFLAFLHTPSVQHEAGAAGLGCIFRQAAPLSRQLGEEGDAGMRRWHPPIGGVLALRMGMGGGEEG